MDTKTTTAMTQSEYDGLVVGDRIVRLSTGTVCVVSVVNGGWVYCQMLKGGKPWGRCYSVRPEGYAQDRA
jgi:hypothetical protein